MAYDWTADVKKHIATPDQAALDGIVKYLGIALQSRDSSYVACSNKSERDRVRDSFLRTKLGLSAPDADLDAAVLEICEKMKGDRSKSRVAFYYLLAEKYQKLSLFSA
jgi:uncharacterized protein DUF2853